MFDGRWSMVDIRYPMVDFPISRFPDFPISR